MSAVILLLSLTSVALASSHGPFTQDFVSFLKSSPVINEYTLSSFKHFGSSGTFGGRSFKGQNITNQPVLFVHGSSDSALNHSKLATGWTKSVEYFKANGYSGAELYGLTYGTRDINFSLESRISCRDLLGLRQFMETILEYTEAEKIDIVAHSMGVTLARMAVKGGLVNLTGESCDLGVPLSNKVDALVAISGANYGMCMCLMAGVSHMPMCGQTGFAPGKCGRAEAGIGECMYDTNCKMEGDYSQVLFDINNNGQKEAHFIASLWSNGDTRLGSSNLVWGRKTSVVAGSDITHAYDGMDHNQSKDNTVEDQLALVSKHSLHGGRI